MAYTIICQRQAGKNLDRLDYLRNKNPQATIEQNAESSGATIEASMRSFYWPTRTERFDRRSNRKTAASIYI